MGLLLLKQQENLIVEALVVHAMETQPVQLWFPG
jgi:hypothetical protein